MVYKVVWEGQCMTKEELILEQKSFLNQVLSGMPDMVGVRKVHVELLIRTNTETAVTRLVWNNND